MIGFRFGGFENRFRYSLATNKGSVDLSALLLVVGSNLCELAGHAGASAGWPVFSHETPAKTAVL